MSSRIASNGRQSYATPPSALVPTATSHGRQYENSRLTADERSGRALAVSRQRTSPLAGAQPFGAASSGNASETDGAAEVSAAANAAEAHAMRRTVARRFISRLPCAAP